jgi:hypothetical protein
MRLIYSFIRLLSLLIRQFALPNPFESLVNGELYNLYATIILVPITYGMVGLLYERGSAPAWGSILFFLIYLANTAVLLFCGWFNFHVVACVILGVVYITLFVAVVRFRNDFGRGY